MIREHWFDMDHTLIDNDCDVSWKDFMVAKRLAPVDALEQAAYFFKQYQAGTLDLEAFSRFQLTEFVGQTPETMRALTQEHFDTVVKRKIYPKAFDLVQELKDSGLRVTILTSTNTVLARPLARYFGVHALFGMELEVIDGRFTGRYAGRSTVGPGKAEVARDDAALRGVKLEELAYYGDSINDRFVLEAVGRAYAANPDPALAALAEERGWQTLSFRD